MKNATATYTSADQDWNASTTTYWFELTGTDYGTEHAFDGDVYGVVESGSDIPVIVDCDGCPLTDGDTQTLAVRNTISVIDAIRKEANGL